MLTLQRWSQIYRSIAERNRLTNTPGSDESKTYKGKKKRLAQLTLARVIMSSGPMRVLVMGNPMCANLSRKSGLPVYGADRDADAVMRLADTPNFHDCASITEVARQADVVFLSLPAIKQVVDVCLGPGGLLQNPGRVKAIVDMSTSSVEGPRALAAKVRAAGIAYLDAPVARLREAARLGTLSIMVGGSQADFDVVRPFLATMGSDITLCGEVGAGFYTFLRFALRQLVLQGHDVHVFGTPGPDGLHTGACRCHQGIVRDLVHQRHAANVIGVGE